VDRANVEAVRRWGCRKPEAKKKQKKPQAVKVTAGLVTNVLEAMSSYVARHDDWAPFWLIEQPPFPAAETAAFRNGLLHLQTFAEGRASLRRERLDFFTTNVLDYDFDAEAPAPVEWLKFLERLWPNDPESVATLQEFAGYLLTSDVRQHKAIMIVGPPASGKGTIGRVLTALVGEANVAGPTLASLSGRFGLAPLVGKSLAIIPDARQARSADPVIALERLLSVIGADRIDVDRKNDPALPSVKLHSRVVVLTNELPKWADASNASGRRFLFLRLRRSWVGEEDATLGDRLALELPGIALWAIAGWRRLQERGKFLQPTSGESLHDTFRRTNSPVREFVDDCCDVRPGLEVSTDDLFRAYRQWSQESGREFCGDKATLGKNLLAAVPTRDEAKQVRRDRKQVRVYSGIGLKQP
jgi:putative DNA primase/helicase